MEASAYLYVEVRRTTHPISLRSCYRCLKFFANIEHKSSREVSDDYFVVFDGDLSFEGEEATHPPRLFEHLAIVKTNLVGYTK